MFIKNLINLNYLDKYDYTHKDVENWREIQNLSKILQHNDEILNNLQRYTTIKDLQFEQTISKNVEHIYNNNKYNKYTVYIDREINNNKIYLKNFRVSVPLNNFDSIRIFSGGILIDQIKINNKIPIDESLYPIESKIISFLEKNNLTIPMDLTTHGIIHPMCYVIRIELIANKPINEEIYVTYDKYSFFSDNKIYDDYDILPALKDGVSYPY